MDKYEIINPAEHGACLECGHPLVGRTDKKFCCGDCKNRYHNRERNAIRRFRNKTMADLETNYRILEWAVDTGSTSIPLEILDRMGFNPGCVTFHGQGEKGHTEYGCFDIRYYQSGSKIFNIRRERSGCQSSPVSSFNSER